MHGTSTARSAGQEKKRRSRQTRKVEECRGQRGSEGTLKRRDFLQLLDGSHVPAGLEAEISQVRGWALVSAGQQRAVGLRYRSGLLSR